MDDSEWVYNEDDDIESEDVLDLLDGSEYESLSVCESALLDDETLLGLPNNGDPGEKVEALVKVEEPPMEVTKRRRVCEDGDDGQDAGQMKSNIIRLDRKGKFRYVPDTLPDVELPELAKKRGRRSPAKKRHKMLTDTSVEPTLLLDVQSQPSSELQSEHSDYSMKCFNGVVDLRSILLANRKNQSPSLEPFNTASQEPDSSTTDTYANLNPTSKAPNTGVDLACESTSPDPSNSSEQSSTSKQLPHHQSHGLTLAASVDSSSKLPTFSSPSLPPVMSETTTTIKSSSVGVPQNIFAFRPSFFSRAPPAQFSLQHLITSSPSRFTFSLDHLRS